jgi:hypothetical protein
MGNFRNGNERAHGRDERFANDNETFMNGDGPGGSRFDALAAGDGDAADGDGDIVDGP